jgi:hypothetical protein
MQPYNLLHWFLEHSNLGGGNLGNERQGLFFNPTEVMKRLGGYPIYYTQRNQANKI